MTDAAPEDAGVGAALDVLGGLDRAALAEVLEHRAELTGVYDLLGDDEEVTWLHAARMWQGSGGLAGLLVVTDRRLLFLPPPQSGFPPGSWGLDQLSSVSQAGPQRVDILIAGVRLVLLVRDSTLAEATVGVLVEYLTAPEPDPGSPPTTLVDELTKWANLWRMGAISNAEFEHRKAELLRRPEAPA